MSEKAAFQLNKYVFNSVFINLENQKPSEVSIDFDPSGVFDSENSTYELKFIFSAFNTDSEDTPFIKIQCLGTFSFENVKTVAEIPSFFYRNAIAILFPYVRAFISTVTLQANIPPMILPTYNLSELEAPLKENTLTK